MFVKIKEPEGYGKKHKKSKASRKKRNMEGGEQSGGSPGAGGRGGGGGGCNSGSEHVPPIKGPMDRFLGAGRSAGSGTSASHADAIPIGGGSSTTVVDLTGEENVSENGIVKTGTKSGESGNSKTLVPDWASGKGVARPRPRLRGSHVIGSGIPGLAASPDVLEEKGKGRRRPPSPGASHGGAGGSNQQAPSVIVLSSDADSENEENIGSGSGSGSYDRNRVTGGSGVDKRRRVNGNNAAVTLVETPEEHGAVHDGCRSPRGAVLAILPVGRRR